jgi:hypothetical protein
VSEDLPRPGAGPDAATRAAVEQALHEFADGVIARMVPVAPLLRRAMPA